MWSSGEVLAFLTESWPSSLRDFGEYFAAASDISKAFDRVWHKALISKLPSYGYFPSLFTLILSVLSDCSIATVVDGHCFFSKPINSGVPQRSDLSPTLFLLFINDMLNLTLCPVHSYADDSSVYYSTSFNRRPSGQELYPSRSDASERLISDFCIISSWGTANLDKFSA